MSDVLAPGLQDITDSEFAQFQRLFFQLAGINLSDAKKVLLVGRLSRRLKHFGFATFGQYFRYVTSGGDRAELQTVVDLLTTNETYFFREAQHFDFLRELALRRRGGGQAMRVWSAASSSGEEAYSMAMVLADTLGAAAWEIVGSDISTQMLAKAELGHYAMARTDGIPPALLKRYCLRGTGEQAGTLLIERSLRERVCFVSSNLMAPRQDLGSFDVIFLRNVMIYFDNRTKRRVVANLLPFLKPDGHFIVGHSESLHGLCDELSAVRPTIYRRTVRA